MREKQHRGLKAACSDDGTDLVERQNRYFLQTQSSAPPVSQLPPETYNPRELLRDRVLSEVDGDDARRGVRSRG
jgi:hypothetical protein